MLIISMIFRILKMFILIYIDHDSQLNYDGEECASLKFYSVNKYELYVDDDDQEPRSPNVAKSGDAVTVMRDKYM